MPIWTNNISRPNRINPAINRLGWETWEKMISRDLFSFSIAMADVVCRRGARHLGIQAPAGAYQERP